MSVLPFNITNPGIFIDGLLTSAERTFVTNLFSLPYVNGDILYHNGTSLTRLPIGTAANVLTVSGGIPAWQTPAAGFADPLTTNGDIIARISGATTRLPQGAGGTFLGVSGGLLGYYTPSGTGDMILASTQINSGLKTFQDGTFGLRNVANTFTSLLTNTNTAARTYTTKDASGTLAFVSDITGVNSGTNSGDQTTIVGITGTKAQFDTAVSDGNIQYVGDAPTAHTHLLAAGATDVTVTAANLNILDDGLNTTLHFHDADRARANHTGSQLAGTISDFASTVLATVLTGISFVTGTAVVAADSILVAIGKLQKQNTDQDTAINLKANLASPTFTGIVTVPTPTNATDAVTKGYADAITQSLDIKQSVRVASTVNIAVATALVNASTIDGVAVATGDRVLLKNQTLPAENGIYTVVASGAAPRAIDADVSADVTTGMYVFVSEGTISADMGYVLTTNDPITLGTTGLVFTQFSGAGQITVDSTLVKTGNQLKRAPITGDIAIPDASNASTLATVNANVGSFGLAASVSQFTVNAKGLITAAANVAISITSSAVTDFATTVRGTVLTGLSLVSTTVISATDTVLVALGSLQAQITALTTTVGTKANNSTTISTTAPLSGGGDLSANRTLTTSMNTNRLIGRGTAAVGVMEEIILGTNLSLTGNTLNAGGGGTTTNFNTVYVEQSGGTSDTYGVLAGLVNGTNALYTVAQALYATGTLKVYLNGQLLTQGTGEDWTETLPGSGTFTFIVAPAIGSLITVEYQRVTTSSSTVMYARQVASIAVGTTAGATTNTDYVYFTTATLTLTLPTAVGNTNRYTVKCIAGTLTIDGAGAETIDGTATISVQVEDSVDLISNGTEFKVV